MLFPSPRTRLEQLQAELSHLAQQLSGLSSVCQGAIAAEIDRFSSQLSDLVASDDNGVDAHPSQKNNRIEVADILHESETHLGTVLRGADIGVFIIDLKENTSYWSSELRDLLGIDHRLPSSLENFLAMVHPEDRAAVIENTQAAIAKGGPMYQEFRLILPRGGVTWLSSVGYVEHDREGQPATVIGLNQDITQRKVAEERLRQREAQLEESERQARQQLAEIETIYKNAPIGLCVFDSQLRWVRLNQAIAEINGVPLEAHLGKTPMEVIPDIGPQAEEAMRKIMETGEPLLDFEMSGTTSAQPGVQRFWRERWIPIKDEQGSIVGISVAAEEITENKRLEQEKRDQQVQIELQRQLMEQREQERQGVARDIHDGPIQSLVSTIFNIQAMKETLDNPQLEAEINQIGLSIKNAVQELRDVINELRPPVLNKFGLTQTMRMHSMDIKDRYPNLKLFYDLADDGDVLSDDIRLALHRIYQEAMSNVIRHSEATSVHVRFAIGEGAVVLEIEDNGKGFHQPTDRIQQTAGGHYGMTGMQERAEAAGGEIMVQSTPGEGTSIKAKIPLNS